jgi:hypothetical protein
MSLEKKRVGLGLTKVQGDLMTSPLVLWSGSEDKRAGGSWKRQELFDPAKKRFLLTSEGQRH